MKPRPTLSAARRMLLLAAALAGLAGAGCQRAGPHNRVAVLDFENQLPPEGTTELVQAASQRLTDYMVNQGGIWVIARPDVQAMLKSSGFRTFVRGSQGHLKRLGKKLKADYLILGAISNSNTDYVISAELFSVATGRSVPGTATTRVAARYEDIEPNLFSLARFMAYQISNYAERERLARAAAFSNVPPPSGGAVAPAIDPVPAPAAAAPAPAAPAPAPPQGRTP